MSIYHHQTGDYLGRFPYESELESPSSAPTHHATREGRPIRPIRLGPREDPPEVSLTEEDDEIEILDTPPPPSPQKFKTEAATLKPMAKPMSTGHKQAPQLILPIGSPEGPLMMHHLVRLSDVLKSRTVRLTLVYLVSFF
jgi:hypothetical protein